MGLLGQAFVEMQEEYVTPGQMPRELVLFYQLMAVAVEGCSRGHQPPYSLCLVSSQTKPLDPGKVQGGAGSC